MAQKFIGVLLFSSYCSFICRQKNQEGYTVAKIAVSIYLEAQPGQEEKLASLLAGAAEIVKATEPTTLYWFATRTGSRKFTINDGFANENGLKNHFGGKVAALLKEQAPELVVGGWENGVLPNIVQADILSIIL